MTTPFPLPECVHRGSVLDGMQLCRKRRGWKPFSACEGCADRVEGTALPIVELPSDLIQECQWRGDSFHEPQACGCPATVELFRCSHPSAARRYVARTEIERATVPEDLRAAYSCEACQIRHQPANLIPASRRKWITTAELIEDTLSLIPRLTGYQSIIGVARSGLAPAALLAQMLHLPLYILRQTEGDLIHAGHGWRLHGRETGLSRPLLVDDTIGSGTSMQRSLELLWAREILPDTCVIYQHPQAQLMATHCAKYLGNPHVLEWNVGNSPYSDRIVWDMDGLICEDCPPECDDDGPRYLDWMRAVKPKCLTRRSRITIATGRREKWRSETLAWLDRHGVQAELRMHADGERTFESIVSHKARICTEFPATAPHGHDHTIGMLESDPHQAPAIERLAGRPAWHC